MDAKYHPLGESLNEEEKHEYASSESSGATLLNEESQVQFHNRSRSWANSKWLWATHVFLFAISASIIVRGYLYSLPTTIRCVEEYSAWSPAANAVVYEEVKFNQSKGIRTQYMGANTRVDAAWNAISYDVGDQMISRADLDKIGKPESTTLKITDPRTGEVGYRVGLEVFHQLHCLNFLRKVSYYHYYNRTKDPDFVKGLDNLQVHADHCIDSLRINIMCQSDVGVVTYHQMPGKEPWDDHSTWHMCRNFDHVLNWAKENTVATDKI